MVDEMRTTQADINNRRHFTEPKKPIKDTRTVLDEYTAPAIAPELRQAVSAASLKLAADDGFIEVG